MNIKYHDIQIGNARILNAGEIMLDAGSITVVSGESGSGKTTLMIEIAAQLTKSQELYCSSSVLVQVPLFLDSLTLREHCNLLMDLTGEKISLDSYIDRLQLAECMDKLPQQLSGGEQKRAGLLLCLCKGTGSLILDEPTASLNREFTSTYIEIFKELKENGKAILIFTHDEALMETADIRYHIKNHELIQIKDKEESGREIVAIKRKNINKLPDYFFQMEKHKKGYHKALNLILIISIALIAAGSTFSEKIYQVQQNALKKVYSDSLIVFAPSENYIQNGKATYSFSGMEEPLDDEDVSKFRNIDGVQSVSWRFDMIEPDTCMFYDNTTNDFQACIASEGTVHSMKLSFTKNGDSLGTYQLEKTTTLSSYEKGHIVTKEIEMDFDRDGIFISKTLAQDIAGSLGITTDGLNNTEMTFELAYPIYNTFGRVMGGNDERPDPVLLYSTTLAHKSVTVQIAGILKGQTFGFENNKQNAMYYERGILEELINNDRRTESRKIYTVKDTEFLEYYLNEVPADNNKEIGRVFEDSPWKPTAYTVYLKGLEYKASVIQQLKEMGYSVLSDYSNITAMSSGIYAMKDLILIMTIILSVIIVVYMIAVANLQKNKEEKIDAYFLSIGLTKEEIYQTRKTYHSFNVLHQFLWIIGAYIVVSVILSVVQKGPFLPAGSAFIVFAVMDFLNYDWLPNIVDHRRLK